MRNAEHQRQAFWTESVAVGGVDFVERIQRELGGRGRYREIEQVGDAYVLRDPAATYGDHFDPENGRLGAQTGSI